MAQRICSIEGCERPVHGRWWCSMHHQRWRKHGSPLGRWEGPSEHERFWAKVDVRSLDECWPWMGAHHPRGYGVFRLHRERRNIRAPRQVFLWAHGYLPPVVRHACDNPPCVNPLHLVAGTYSENRHDAVQRGQWWSKKPAVGERNGNTRLTWDQVREMRRARALGDGLTVLAGRFEVSKHTVWRIVTGQAWREESE